MMNIPNERELKKFNGDYNKCLIEINKRLLKDNNSEYNWFIPIEVYLKINNSGAPNKVLLKDYNREHRWFVPKQSGGYSHLTDDEIKEIDDKLEDRFKNKKNK